MKRYECKGCGDGAQCIISISHDTPQPSYCPIDGNLQNWEKVIGQDLYDWTKLFMTNAKIALIEEINKEMDETIEEYGYDEPLLFEHITEYLQKRRKELIEQGVRLHDKEMKG